MDYSEAQQQLTHNQRSADFVRLGFIPDWAEFMAESDMSVATAKLYLAGGCPHEVLVHLAV